MIQKQIILWIVALFALSPLWTVTGADLDSGLVKEEEIVNLDELGEEVFDLNALDDESEESVKNESSGHSRRGGGMEQTQFRFSLMGDLNFVYTNPSGSVEEPSLTFGQEHAELFLTVEGPKGLTVSTDVARITEYLEFHFPMEAVFPFVDEGSFPGSPEIYMGNILIPFGEYSFHHLYGGNVEASRSIVGTLWTELGVGINIKPFPRTKVDFYVFNGMSSSETDVSLIGSDKDSNLYKGVGTRLRLDLTSGSFISGSALTDIFGNTDNGEGWAFAGGLDAGFKVGSLDVVGGALYMPIRRSNTQNINMEKWAWYSQVTSRITPMTRLRFRAGQVDLDTRESTNEDQSSAMISLIQRTYIFELHLNYSVTQSTADIFSNEMTHVLSSTFYFRL